MAGVLGHAGSGIGTQGAIAGCESLAVGQGAIAGCESLAVGQGATATGDCSIAVGPNVCVTTECTIVIGKNDIVNASVGCWYLPSFALASSLEALCQCVCNAFPPAVWYA